MLEVTYLDHDSETTITVIAREVNLIIYEGLRHWDIVSPDGMSFVIDERDLYRVKENNHCEKCLIKKYKRIVYMEVW